ncbi:MAG: starch-binding protein [Prevotella sp.]|nr:starch-binding protein [Prevotella sp.]
MKKIILSLAMMLTSALAIAANGWPSNYGGVMLQAFWWDSYDATQWATLTSRADELSQYFDLIWVPNSGETSDWHYSQTNTMGYDPCYWLSQNSCFGTEQELRTLISTYKAKGVGLVADVVINHKNGLGSWANFVDETVTGSTTGNTYTLTWDNTNYTGICSTDEANTNSASGVAGMIQGAADTGDDFNGFRDLDHTNATVQQNVKTYLDYLLNEIGYTGFRYDMVKGFGGSYIKTYNESANPTFSVGECWDSYATITSWIQATGYTSAAFDFPLKYSLYDAFNNSNWSALSNKGVMGDTNYSRYAVTFVDNHDTGRTDGNGSSPLANNWSAANAFILASPGTPCIWLKHYNADPTSIGNMILARKATGVNSQSSYLQAQEQDGGYILETQGTTGSLYVQFGGAVGSAPTGYTLVASGDSYAFYKKVTTQQASVTLSAASTTFTTDTLDITATATNATSAWIQVGSGSKVDFTSTATVTIGDDMAYGDSVTVSWGATGSDGVEVTGSTTYTKQEPAAGISVYVKASSAPYLYVWSEETGSVVQLNGTWPGTLMNTTTTVNGTTYYVFTTTAASTINVIMSDGSGQTADITDITADTYYQYDGGTSYSVVDPNAQDTELLLDDADEVSVFFENSSFTSPTAWVWDGTSNYTGGTWPGQTMTYVGTTSTGNTIYKWTYTGSLTTLPTNVIFSDAGSSQTSDLTFTNHGYYVGETLTKTITEVKEDTVPTSVDITLTADATSYASTVPLDFSSLSDLKAYIASGYVYLDDTLNIVLTRINYVPANTGIILRGTADTTYTVPVEDHQAVVANRLVGVTADMQLSPTDGTYTNYIFSLTAGTFSPLSTTVTLSAGNAYLQIPTALASTTIQAKSLPYIFDDGTVTGIQSISDQQSTDDTWCTITGLRVDKPTKGVYIHKGRKVVVR